MKALQFADAGDRLSVLCLGAHSDDIEIGAGATLLNIIGRGVRLEVHWCVLSGVGEREREARASAADFLAEATSTTIEVMAFRDGLFPEQGEAIKSWFETLKAFPPLQAPASYNLEQVMEQIKATSHASD